MLAASSFDFIANATLGLPAAVEDLVASVAPGPAAVVVASCADTV
jgi:hypothetical protein